MARKKDIPIVEVSRELAPQKDGRVSTRQKAVKKQQERDNSSLLFQHLEIAVSILHVASGIHHIDRLNRFLSSQA